MDLRSTRTHTVAHPHAASDLSRGVGNDGLLNGGLSLEAVGATDRVEDAWLGLGFRCEDWGTGATRLG